MANERHGRWGKAVEVPGLGALNVGGGAEVVSVSCGSAGNCVAGGGYADRRGHFQGFVAVERNGVWRRAIQVPGLGVTDQPIRPVAVQCRRPERRQGAHPGPYLRDRTCCYELQD